MGAAQLDRFGNINTTVIGDYLRPKVRLPGGGGAPEIASSCGKIFIVMRQTARGFVKKLDFTTSLGHGRGGGDRASHGVLTKGPTRVVTDLCVMTPNPKTKAFTVASIHPGVTRERIADNTGWDIAFADQVTETGMPEPHELKALRDLKARTAKAHGGGDKK